MTAKGSLAAAVLLLAGYSLRFGGGTVRKTDPVSGLSQLF